MPENRTMLRTILEERRQRRSQLPNALVSGFTVLELLVVLCVSGLVAAVAVPNVDQAMKTYRSDVAVRQVLNDLQATRMLALSRNVRYRMLLTPNGTTYVRRMRDPVTLAYATVATYSLPAQASFGTNVANPVFAPTGVINIPASASVMIQGAGSAVRLARTITMTAAGSIRLVR